MQSELEERKNSRLKIDYIIIGVSVLFVLVLAGMTLFSYSSGYGSDMLPAATISVTIVATVTILVSISDIITWSKV